MIETSSNDLFQLMLELSRLNSPEQILSVFLEAVNGLREGFRLRPASGETGPGVETLEIATAGRSFGRLEVEGGWPEEAPEFAALMRNAVRLLAVILEDRAQAALLATDNERLEKLVEARLRELLAVNAQLKAEIETRRQAEAALRQNEERLNYALSAVRDAIWDWMPAQNRLFWSPRFLAMLGYDAGEIEPSVESWMRLLHPEDRPTAEYLLRQCEENARDDYRLEARFKTKSEGWKWILIRGRVLARTPQGEILRMTGTHTDIAVRKRGEVELRQYAQRLKFLHEVEQAILAMHSPAAIAEVALKNLRSFLACERASVATFDYAAQMVTILVVAVDGETSVGPGLHIPFDDFGIIQILQRGEPYAVYDLAAEADPSPTRRRLLAEGMHSAVNIPLQAEGHVIGALNLAAAGRNAFLPEHIDIISEAATSLAVALRQAQLHEQVQRYTQELEERVHERTAQLDAASAELRAANRELNAVNASLSHALRSRDEFLATMSHELRTPLTGVLGLSEALLIDVYGPLAEPQRRSVGRIYESGAHLLELINDILDLSKVEAGKLELQMGPVIVDAICQASLQFVREAAQKKRLRMTLQLDAMAGVVEADERRLKQILVNLLGNAVKFTAEGGAVGLEVSGDAGENTLRLTVWDTGIGIAPELMPKLFKPFVQLDSRLAREYEGTGLGLALVRRLTDLHGGSVSVESEGTPGKGCRFAVTLPWGRPTPEPNDASGGEWLPPDSPALSKLPASILLADANETLLNAVAGSLRRLGRQVEVARSGTEALERARAQRPDLILLTMDIPGVNGLEAIRQLRADSRLASVPVIAVTALVIPGDRERCLAAGANAYLPKPVTPARLAKTLEALTGYAV